MVCPYNAMSSALERKGTPTPATGWTGLEALALRETTDTERTLCDPTSARSLASSNSEAGSRMGWGWGGRGARAWGRGP